MTQRQPDPNWIATYDSFFRRDAHQLLAWGYEDARTNINPTLEETEITGFIAEKIDKGLMILILHLVLTVIIWVKISQ